MLCDIMPSTVYDPSSLENEIGVQLRVLHPSPLSRLAGAGAPAPAPDPGPAQYPASWLLVAEPADLSRARLCNSTRCSHVDYCMR